METKEELVKSIKEWITTENKIKELRGKIKEYNTLKKTLSERLINTMKNNEIDCFDITGGSILYKQNKVKKPINGKTLLLALEQYYKDKKSDPSVAKDITQFVLDSRQETVKDVIKHRIDK
jgi:hypothetical protein